MSACCRIGGLAGGLEAEAVEALATYGERIGIAFQIIDDSLDFAADPTRLGKAIGHDLLEGKRTLPLIVTLDRATDDERARILEALGRPGLQDADVAEVHRLVKVYDGVGYSVARASAYAEAGIDGAGAVPRFPRPPDPDPDRRVRDPSGSMSGRRAPRPCGVVTLLTDFGLDDAYVGAVKGVVLGINPRARLVDLTHAVPPQDVRRAALLLEGAWRFFPRGTVHLAVVDPGVGQRAPADRRGGRRPLLRRARQRAARVLLRPARCAGGRR